MTLASQHGAQHADAAPNADDTCTAIMVVDDDPFALKLLSRQLANLGCPRVLPFEDPLAALEHLKTRPDRVGTVCCDLQMPGMDGVEFVRQLTLVGYRGAVVLVSGEDARLLASVERLAKAHRLNVLGALQKPISPDRLRQVLGAQVSAPRTRVAVPPSSYPAEQVQAAIASGQLVNHYQPKVSMSTGRPVGVETLVRWQHPADGLVYPDRFIAVAEQNGLMDALTHAVLSTAMREAAAWTACDEGLHLAVNISMTNLAGLDFPGLVDAAAGQAGFPLNGLVLEITESQAMNDPLAALDILTRLRLKRVGLSIDDFGTGYSSLGQLVNLPFNELKIDRGFVQGAATDDACRAVVEASIGVARRLGMTTVAEGVETEADWHFLRAAGCDVAQGYFIARPMPAVQLAAWREGWRGRMPGARAG